MEFDDPLFAYGGLPHDAVDQLMVAGKVRENGSAGSTTELCLLCRTKVRRQASFLTQGKNATVT